ncbi:MAG TPA: hypothetical protein DCZ94_21580 [Lentisphaeria bacterium]|nr:MAG: hypothetical protein A2X48_14510 [Lentisphaerae bacterium GWF2_49_21]HBC89537.1 hypothetical protein [Lentisphaeria bacterium]
MASNYSNVISLLSADEVVAINTTQTMVNVINAKISYFSERTRFKHLFLYVKGTHASCSKALTFYFQVSPDGVNWHDLSAISVTLSGTDVIVNSDTHVALDLGEINYIRLARVTNAETDAGYTATVNAFLGSKID